MSEKAKLYLGIDTSNYTTSVALCGEDGENAVNVKLPLPVKDGERGLRQSDALFSHTKDMPAAVSMAKEQLGRLYPDGYSIAAVGYSAFPRDREGSYMPCFLAGQASAEAAAMAAGCRAYPFSHQRGHIMAALYSAGALHLLGGRFAAFHVSGGTTEVLLCEPDDELIIKITEVGRTLDINAGQAIDRCGVMMGLHFPAGAELEKLALSYTGKIKKAKICVSGTDCNLSGLENKAAEMYRATGDKAATAAFVIDFVARTLGAMTDGLIKKYGSMPIIYAGGVMSCSIIKAFLAGDGRYFAEPVFSSDNAAGIAYLARLKHMKNG